MLSPTLFPRRQVRQLGALGQLLAERKARRSMRATGSSDPAPPSVTTPNQAKLNIEAAQAGGGVELKALPKYTSARKKQLKLRENAPLYMAIVIAATKRFSDVAEAERAFRRRIAAIAPELLATRSPWQTRLIGGALLCASVVLGASTYSAFAPSREDRIAQMLKAVNLDVSWLLGAAQVFGLTVLGYCVAQCLGFALVAKFAAFKGKRVGGDREVLDGVKGGEDRAGQPIVYGSFSTGTYSVLAGVVFTFALGVVYAIAKLRGYSLALGSAVASSAPSGSGAAGSLGAGAAPQPQQIGIFLMLCSLELVATIVAFLVMDGPVSRALRSLQHNTNKAGKHLIKVGKTANRYRVGAALKGMDANMILASASAHSAQAQREAVRLEAMHRAANPEVYGSTFAPELPEPPEVLPKPTVPPSVGETPVAYGPTNAPHDLLNLLQDEPAESSPADASAEQGAARAADVPRPSVEPYDIEKGVGHPATRENGHHDLSGETPETTRV